MKVIEKKCVDGEESSSVDLVSSNNENINTRCGYGCWKTGVLQFFNNSKGFLFFSKYVFDFLILF